MCGTFSGNNAVWVLTAVTGCTSYAGIPLTHREFCQSVRIIITGHKKGGELDLNWPALCDANPNTGVVLFTCGPMASRESVSATAHNEVQLSGM